MWEGVLQASEAQQKIGSSIHRFGPAHFYLPSPPPPHCLPDSLALWVDILAVASSKLL